MPVQETSKWAPFVLLGVVLGVMKTPACSSFKLPLEMLESRQTTFIILNGNTRHIGDIYRQSLVKTLFKLQVNNFSF